MALARLICLLVLCVYFCCEVQAKFPYFWTVSPKNSQNSIRQRLYISLSFTGISPWPPVCQESLFLDARFVGKIQINAKKSR